MKIIPTFLFTGMIMLLSINVTAQTMALVNGVATQVDYQDGEIIALFETFPNYMSDFEAPLNDNFTKLPPRIAKAETPVAIADEKEAFKKTQEYKVTNALFFEDSNNSLDAESIIRIAGYANEFKSKAMKSFLLKGWYDKSQDESQKKIKERLDESKKALEKQGVPSNLILTSLVGASKESNFVTVITN